MQKAAQRELLEETGLKPQSFLFEGFVKETQDKIDYAHFVFSCRSEKATPKLHEPDKCKGWEWRDPKNISEDILPGHKAAIELSHDGQSFLEIISTSQQ